MRTVLVLWMSATCTVAMGCSGDEFSQSAPGGGSSGASGSGGSGAGTGASGGSSGEAGAGATSGTGGVGGTAGTGGSSGTGGCAADQKLCDGQCVYKTDPAYGCTETGCDRCALPNVAEFFCEVNQCEIGVCEASFDDCDGMAGNGCEASLNQPKTCGSCDHACSPGYVCNAPDCLLDCPVDECSGSCVDLSSDRYNCGTCGNVCSASDPNAQPHCENGSCTILCSGSLTACGDQCVDTNTNTSHCGACDEPCEPPTGGTATCSGGTCHQTCPGSTTLCADVCVQVGQDIDHCSACYQACAPRPNSTVTCSNFACHYTCVSGYADCDGSGCKSLAADPANCGTCGRDCKGATCANGLCVPETLATNLEEPTDLAVDPGPDGSVWWTVLGPNLQSGQVQTVAKVGGSPTVSRSSLESPMTLAVDATRVYVGFSGGIVQYQRAASGPPDVFINSLKPADIALDSGRLYWADHGINDLLSAAKGSGTVTTILTLSALHDPVSPRPESTGDRVYFGTKNTSSNPESFIGHTAKQSNMITSLYTQTTPVGAVAINETTIFWTAPAIGKVMSLDKATGSATKTLVAGEQSPAPIEADGTYLVWAEQLGGGGRIRALGATGPVTLAAGQVDVCAIGLDVDFVYWITCKPDGGVLRVAR